MRKQYSANLKAQLVLEVLKEEKALSQIASEHGVHPNQLRRWKAHAIDGLPTVFADEQRATRELQASHEREVEELYTEIGRLTTQLAWLKKIWPRRCREMSGWQWSNVTTATCLSRCKRSCSA